MTLIHVPDARTPRLSRASRCSITELSPAIRDHTSTFIDGVVSLIWPYSSSTRSIAILLADPDFRIRKAKGQTKVTFHGNSALGVAESHVGIGDIVHLSLEGAKWKQSREDVPDVGKRADWDLEYTGTVLMEVHRGTDLLAVIDMPHAQELVDGPLREIIANGGRKSWDKELWSSPAFAKQTTRLSDPFTETTLRSFVDEDGYIPGRGRKRTKFSRDSGSWRFVDIGFSSDDENRAPVVVSEIETAEADIGASTLPEQDRKEMAVDIEEETVPAKPLPQDHYDHYSPAASEKPAQNRMPPPSLTFAQQQQVDELFVSPSAEITPIGSRVENEDGQHGGIATPPTATTPRLLPVPSPGLPLISPFIKRHGGAIGYFPPVTSAQSELNSSVEKDFQDRSKEDEANSLSPLSDTGASGYQSLSNLGQGAIDIAPPHPPTETVDLTSPVEGHEEQGEGTAPDIQIESPVSDHRATNLEHPVVLPETFEFLNDGPIEPEPESQEILGYVRNEPKQGSADVDSAESLVQPSVAVTGSREASPTFSHQTERYRSVVSEALDQEVLLTSGPPAHTPIDEPTISETSPPIGSDAVEQTDVEQDQTSQVSLAASQRPSHWTESLEISAREVEYDGLALSPPPFPFEQKWDTTARTEIQSGQTVRTIQAVRHRVVRRHSYDGPEDEAGSQDEHYDTVRDFISEGGSLLRHHDGHVVGEEVTIREEVVDLEQNSYFETNDAQVAIEHEASRFRSGNDTAQSAHVLKVDSNAIETPIAQSNLEPGLVIGAKPGEASRPLEDEVCPGDDMVGRQSPPPDLDQEDAQELPEMPLSQPTSHAPQSDADTFNFSSTPKPHLPHDTRIEERKSAPIHIESAKAGDRRSPEASGRHLLHTHQLATPDNTQQEAEEFEALDHLNERQAEKSKAELPPSPQHTQDLPDSQTTEIKERLLEQEKQQTTKDKREILQPEEPVDVKGKQQQTFESEPLKFQPETVPESTAESETLTAPSLPEGSQRRRSSRLSEKMPLLGKSPSKIVSHYFTPRKSLQPQQHEQPQEHEIPSSPPHPPLSPQAKSRDNVVVLIPPPAEKRTDVLKTPTSIIKGFTTPHSYYPPVSLLGTHFDDQVDILAVTITTSKQPQRAKFGPRDYFISLKLADSSCDAGDMISVQLFRPYKNALPSCDRGDVLLLRGMKVQTRPIPSTRSKSQSTKDIGGMLLLSTESSAWAVFKFPSSDQISTSEARPASRDGSNRSPAKGGTPVKMNVQINGPPVEFGAEERAFAKGLNKWWIEEGEAMFVDVKDKPGRKSGGKEMKTVDEIDHLHEHELRDGMAYGDINTPRPMHEHFQHDEQVHHGDEEGGLHEHELRDGMAYGDTIDPKPIHEHHHDHHGDHNLEHHQMQHRDQSNHEAKDTSEEGASILHEHELRDGMAYGDVTNPLPLHEHIHHKDHHHPDQTLTTADTSTPEQKVTHSRNLRNSTSNTNTDVSPASVSDRPKATPRTRRRRRRGSSGGT